MTTPKPRFTGIFIPAEILMREDLSSTDIMLLSWIDALQCEERGGCFASNEYFATKLKLKENTVKILISKLVDLGLVERVSFDGRTRILKSCKEKWFSRPYSQSTADVDLNQPQTLKKINPCPSEKSTPSYIENKGDIKDTKKAAPVCVSFGSFVRLKEGEYDKLVADHGKVAIDQLIVQMNDYCAAKGTTYKDYAAALRQWLARRKDTTTKATYANPKDAIKQRQMEDYTKQNGGFDDNTIVF